MGLSPRSPQPPAGSAGSGTYPIARSFGIVVLLALIVLFVVRHLFGGIDVRAGLK